MYVVPTEPGVRLEHAWNRATDACFEERTEHGSKEDKECSVIRLVIAVAGLGRAHDDEAEGWRTPWPHAPGPRAAEWRPYWCCNVLRTVRKSPARVRP
jgi:hypothetical protein